MGLAANVHGADLCRVHMPAEQGIAGRFDSDRCRILVHIGDGLLKYAKTAGDVGRVCAPHTGNLFDLNAVSRYIHTVGNDAYHSFSLRVLTILSTSMPVQNTVMRSRSAIFATIG